MTAVASRFPVIVGVWSCYSGHVGNFYRVIGGSVSHCLGLAPTVAIIGSNTNNLGRADEINLYNAANLLEDRLAYDDQTIPGSVRANNVSANTNPEFHGTNNVAQWTLSVLGDARGSYRASGPTTPNSIANPGIVALPVVAVVPEPATFGMVLGGFFSASLRNRRRK